MEAVKKLKVTELKKILESYSLPLHGKKDDLVDRVFELISKENKTLEELIEHEPSLAKSPVVSKEAAKPSAEAADEKPSKSTEKEEDKDKKWYTEYLERKERLAKFGGEISEKDKKIERMMRFGQLTKDDPASKLQSRQVAKPQHRRYDQDRSYGRYNRPRGGRQFAPRGRSSRPY